MKLKNLLLTGVISLASLSFIVAENESVTKNKLKATKKDRSIASFICKFLNHSHYSKPTFDDQLSEKWLEEYLKALDPQKSYFYASDIKKIDIYKKSLDEIKDKGTVSIAFGIFTLFKKRVNERTAYALKVLETTKFDFNKDEYISTDRKDAAWINDIETMNQLWNKRVKSQLLTYKLVQKSMKIHKEDGDLSTADKELEKDNKFYGKLRSPKERATKAFARIKKYYNDLENDDIMEIFMSAMTGTFDPHSNYMSPKTLEDFEMNMRLSLCGIGAQLTQDEMGFIKITKIIAGGPAMRANNLKAGDRIIAAAQSKDEEPVDLVDVPTDKAVQYIRGESGAPVYLTIIDGEKGMNSKPKQIVIVRGKIALEDSSAKGELKVVKRADLTEAMKKSLTTKETKESYRVGVIRIPSFYQDFEAVRNNDPNARSLTKDVLRELNKITKDGAIDSLVLDLRSNGGGSLDEAIKLTGLFIPTGPVVQVKGSRGLPIVYKDLNPEVSYSGPLVVMVNHMSASASEIFAGALQDYKRAIIVGDSKTHGKGTVQSPMDIRRYLNNYGNCGAIKYTMQKFYRITGASTQLKGVTPDIIYPSFAEEMGTGEETYEYALPWDEINKQKYQTYGECDKLAVILNASKDQRINSNQEFKDLIKKIEDYAKERDKKEISLSLSKRLEKLKKDEEISKLVIKSLAIKSDDDDNKATDKDLYLEEAMNVAIDLTDLMAK